ncbi:hypothetical protein [Roseibium aggregatum]|uniref:hypothetical protein n=1 Tax=Roseibium aggregatum TaxID=187304 RepID=UPI001E5C3FBB|nr:hypothetical protein [Roseibium aggregatum]
MNRAGADVCRAHPDAGNSSSLPTSVLAFETRWDEAKFLRDVMRGSKSKRKSRHGNDNSVFVERAMSRRETVRQRLEEGFRCFGETIGGRFRAPFEEAGLRSHDHHLLRCIVQLTPKAKRLQTGRGKGVMSQGDSKLLALDDPWIVLNSEFRAVFRIDLDFTYRSWEALRFEIEQLDLPCLPNIAVGFELADGAVERPHLLYFLPFGSEVWAKRDDERCRADILSLWKGVHAGITKQFITLGADPGALSNALRIKNPLSPFWRYRIWNEDLFPDLSEWSSWVDTYTSREAMMRESAAKVSGLGLRSSNALFTTCQQLAFGKLREWHDRSNPDYVSAITADDRDQLDRQLFNSLVGPVSKSASNPKQAQAVLYRVTSYASRRWDPKRAAQNDNKDRGACADEVVGLTTVSARQAVGGRYAANLEAERTCERIAETIAQLRSEGARLTKSAVARRSGFSRPTVHKHWEAASRKALAV